MTPKERRIEVIKNKIEESKNELKAANQNGPLLVAFVGIVLMFTPLFGLGFIIVILAILWSYSKSTEATRSI